MPSSNDPTERPDWTPPLTLDITDPGLYLILDRVYPVGTPYFNKVDNRDPQFILGFGRWAQETGKVLVGQDTADPQFDQLAETGGEKTNTLTVAQLPNVSGSFTIHGQEGGSIFYNKTGYATATQYNSGYKGVPGTTGGAHSQVSPGFNFGSGQSHNNLQPYVVYSWWVRIA